jgi:RNA-directed DNA polymerase
MMHGRWKSDSAVVAEKSVNKAELSAAELMERRAGAKGNVDQQTTCRAQNRESVSQALERIRQAARHRKKERSPRSSTTSALISFGSRSLS